MFFFIFILAANVDKHIFLKKNYSFYYAFAVSNHNSVDRRKAVVFSFFSQNLVHFSNGSSTQGVHILKIFQFCCLTHYYYKISIIRLVFD